MTRVIMVLGPTATGKTALGIALAKALDGEVVNGDALQVYRGFDIGTAKATAREQAEVPHHLIDVLAPQEPHTAGDFVVRARRVIETIVARGRMPIVVGGSGLYLRALVEGLSPIPKVPQRVRDLVQERLDGDGLEALFARLGEVDPLTASRLKSADRQRICRALEVFEATGRSLSSWQREPPREPALQATKVGLTLPRAILYDRVARRVRGMVDDGWVAEVRTLLGNGVDRSAPAFQAIGYRHIADHVLGHLPLEQAVEETIRATRRYAKRQCTWFRRERDVDWLDALTVSPGMDSLVQRLLARRRKLAQ
jgi:tRNA dimethylallyltransferase